MALSYPFVTVLSPKGGVGVTTLAAALWRLSPIPVVGVDATASVHWPILLQTSYTPIVDVIRRRAGLAERVERLLQNERPLLASNLESELFPEGTMTLLQMLSGRRAMVVDAGRGEDGRLLVLANRVLVVSNPDVRAVQAVDRFLGRHDELRSKMVLVENLYETGGRRVERAQGLPAWRLPVGRGGFHALLRGPVGHILKELAADLFPVPGLGEETEAETQGIIRHLFQAEG